MATQLETRDEVMDVVVTSIAIPFWNLVGLLVKVSLASIPAMIMVGFVLTVIVLFLGSLGVALGGAN